MKKTKLVLADDDRVILSTLMEGLEDANYEVFTASNGREALDLCKKVSPDLAILDMRMPEMSGIEAAKRLCEETNTPFMFFSAYNDIGLVSDAINHGGMGYVVKPIDVPNLIPTIEAALKRSRDLQDLTACKSQLTQALEQDRHISVATGLIMERYKISEKLAFEKLRSHARSHRRPLKQVAKEIIDSVETLNSIGIH